MASYLVAGASLLALAAAQGQAVITNNCGFPVYYEFKPSGASGPIQTFAAGGSPLTFPYPAAGAGGWALQFSPTYNSVAQQADITQLEVSTSSGTVWYDISNVNSSAAGAATAVSTYAFAQWGFTLSSSQSGCGAGASNNCATCGCAPGDNSCAAAYQYNSDDAAAMHDTTMASNVQLVLCQGPGGASSNAGSPAVSSAVSSVAGSMSSAAASATSQVASLAGVPSAASTLLNANNFAPAGTPAGKAAGGVLTTTVVQPAVVTSYVTATAAKHLHRRHEHLHRHAQH